jgi:hypothetical protein
MNRTPFLFAGAAVTLLSVPAAIVAQADAVADLQKEFPAKQNAFFTELSKQSKDPEASKKTYEAYQKYVKEFGLKAVAAVRANPKSPATLSLLSTVLSSSPEQGAAVVALIQEHYVADPRVAEIISSLVYSDSPEAEKALLAIREKNPEPKVKAEAAYSLGKRTLQRFSVYSRNPVPEAERAAVIARAEGYLKEARDKYASKNIGPGKDRIEKDLIALGNVARLQIGQVAPDITGEDVDGTPFKLSDYRGRVILLDFWGHW